MEFGNVLFYFTLVYAVVAKVKLLKMRQSKCQEGTHNVLSESVSSQNQRFHRFVPNIAEQDRNVLVCKPNVEKLDHVYVLEIEHRQVKL